MGSKNRLNNNNKWGTLIITNQTGNQNTYSSRTKPTCSTSELNFKFVDTSPCHRIWKTMSTHALYNRQKSSNTLASLLPRHCVMDFPRFFSFGCAQASNALGDLPKSTTCKQKSHGHGMFLEDVRGFGSSFCKGWEKKIIQHLSWQINIYHHTVNHK